MTTVQSLRHTIWECKYHEVWIPKYRRKVLYGELRQHLVEVLRELARQRECRVEEGHLLADHVHMLGCKAPGCLDTLVGVFRRPSGWPLSDCL